MRALVYHGPEDVRCETVPDPQPASTNDAVIKIERTAICGSDLHIYHGHFESNDRFTLGHESIGEIVETGSGVSQFQVGDRVLVSGVVGCGACPPCRKGTVTACERGVGGLVFGTNQGLPGGQAEALAVPNADVNLCRIPEGVSAEQAVLLTDILPTGYFGARGAEILPGQDIAVVGCGPVGLMAILSAQLFGPARIFALDAVPERLAVAKSLGAIPCDINDGAAEKIFEATGGLGAHSVIEAVGANASIISALELVRRGGCVSVVGVNLEMAMPFPMGLALSKGITFRIGICPIPEFWPRLIPLIAEGRIRPEIAFSHRMKLSQGSEAYALFASRRDGVLKVLLDPSG
jgi:threonine dehydrogenase-like Zn-dependent dehydrogenase